MVARWCTCDHELIKAKCTVCDCFFLFLLLLLLLLLLFFNVLNGVMWCNCCAEETWKTCAVWCVIDDTDAPYMSIIPLTKLRNKRRLTKRRTNRQMMFKHVRFRNHCLFVPLSIIVCSKVLSMGFSWIWALLAKRFLHRCTVHAERFTTQVWAYWCDPTLLTKHNGEITKPQNQKQTTRQP